MRKVEVHASRNYDILIGHDLMAHCGEWCARVIKPCTAALITDDVVDALYADTVKNSLESAGYAVHKFVFPNGERSKNWQTLGEMLEFMAEHQLTRGDIVVALGGGVTGDMAGFAAAVYARGIRFVQIPTTLLAAVDSSVGGKTAVDLKAGKNMAGAFHQPELVICDTDVLKALPEERIWDGAGEMLKYGILQDPELFESMKNGTWQQAMEETVAKCVSIKRDYVMEDEKDTGVRQFLNLGHTFGHAVEKCSGFSISHGQGVGIGLLMAARAAGVAVSQVEEALKACGLPTQSPYPARQLSEAALSDKKRKGGKITLVLPEKIGKCCLKTIPVEELPFYFAHGTGETL